MSLFEEDDIITNLDTNTRDDYILFFTENNYKPDEIIKYMKAKAE